MNWNQWVFQALSNDSFILDRMATEDILPGGSAEGRRERKPFILFRVGADSPELQGDMKTEAVAVYVDVWVHDEPGSYKQINEVLSHLVSEWEGPTPSASSGVACLWQGNSPELSDEGYGTIARYASFKMIGVPQ